MTSKKDVHFVVQHFLHFPLSRNTLRVLFVCYYRTEGTILSTSQWPVCSSTVPAPFRRLSTPTEEYCGMRMAHHDLVETQTASIHTVAYGTRRWMGAIRSAQSS